MLALLGAGIGVAIAPASIETPAGVSAAAIDGLPIERELRVYAVQGRQRSPSAAMLLTQLRAADWSRFQIPPPAAAAA